MAVTAQLPFTLSRPSSSAPVTNATDVDITAIEGIDASNVQEALAQIYIKAGVLTDDQIAAALTAYLDTHPIDSSLTDAQKTILATLITDTLAAYKNVQPDWNEEDTTSAAYIKNKPTIDADGGAFYWDD